MAAFQGLVGEAKYFDAAASDTDKIEALLEFVAWCVSESDQAGIIASKVSAVLHFHGFNSILEMPTLSALTKRALKVVAQSHAAAGTPKTSASPHFVGCTVGRTASGLSLGPGWPISLDMSRVVFCFVARSEEISLR